MSMRRQGAGFRRVQGHKSRDNCVESAGKLKMKTGENNLKRKKSRPHCERCFRRSHDNSGFRTLRYLQLGPRLPY